MIVIFVVLWGVWAGLLWWLWPASWPWPLIPVVSALLGLMTFWWLDEWSKR